MSPPKSHKVMVAGNQVRLPALSDEEYDAVEDMALRRGKLSLDVCPTCNGKRIEANEDYYGWENGQYRFMGEVFDCDCQGQMALYRHYLHAAIPSQYMRLDWDEFTGDPQIKADIEKYMTDWRKFKKHGMGVTLLGKLGKGKTFAATAIAKSVIKRGEQVFFTEFRTLQTAYESLTIEQRQELDRRAREATLLVLDEISIPKSDAQGDYFERVLETVIRDRTNWDLPTILTSNLTEEDFKDAWPRLHSLLYPKQWVITFNGAEDFRENELARINHDLVINDEVRPLV